MNPTLISIYPIFPLKLCFGITFQSKYFHSKFTFWKKISLRLKFYEAPNGTSLRKRCLWNSLSNWKKSFSTPTFGAFRIQVSLMRSLMEFCNCQGFISNFSLQISLRKIIFHRLKRKDKNEARRAFFYPRIWISSISITLEGLPQIHRESFHLQSANIWLNF